MPPSSQASTPLFMPLLQDLQVTQQNMQQMPSSPKTNKINKQNTWNLNFWHKCHHIIFFLIAKKFSLRFKKEEWIVFFWSNRKWCGITIHFLKNPFQGGTVATIIHNCSLGMSKHMHSFIFRLQEKITRIIICSDKQALSQSKQVPPTFKATNSCPPTTPPKTSKQSSSRAQAFSTSHTAAKQPAGLLCRCLKANQLSTRQAWLAWHPARLRLKLHLERKRWEEGKEDRDRGTHNTLRWLDAPSGRPILKLWFHASQQHLHDQSGLH